jgi:hypothetical protein
VLHVCDDDDLIVRVEELTSLFTVFIFIVIIITISPIRQLLL